MYNFSYQDLRELYLKKLDGITHYPPSEVASLITKLRRERWSADSQATADMLEALVRDALAYRDLLTAIYVGVTASLPDTPSTQRLQDVLWKVIYEGSPKIVYDRDYGFWSIETSVLPFEGEAK